MVMQGTVQYAAPHDRGLLSQRAHVTSKSLMLFDVTFAPWILLDARRSPLAPDALGMPLSMSPCSLPGFFSGFSVNFCRRHFP